MTGNWARISNLVLGIWLFLSAFAWRHTPQQLTNTWLVGVVIAAIALVSMASPRARFFNTAAAIWLFISSFALPTTGETVWNNIVVALLVFAFSLVPQRERHAGPFAHQHRVRV